MQSGDLQIFLYDLSAPAGMQTGGKDLELLEKLKEYGVDVDAAVALFFGKKYLY